MRKYHTVEAPRFCTQCRMSRPRRGGREIVLRDGKHARWVCATCGAAQTSV